MCFSLRYMMEQIGPDRRSNTTVVLLKVIFLDLKVWFCYMRLNS